MNFKWDNKILESLALICIFYNIYVEKIKLCFKVYTLNFAFFGENNSFTLQFHELKIYFIFKINVS